jgi:hypothetical protein
MNTSLAVQPKLGKSEVISHFSALTKVADISNISDAALFNFMRDIC